MAIVEAAPATSDGRRHFTVRSPATLESIGEFRAANAADVNQAVARARAAQPAWAALGPRGRAAHLDRARAYLVTHLEEFAERIIADTGRSRTETVMMEIMSACDVLQYCAKRAPKILRDRRVRMHLMPHKKLRIVCRPLGVVGIIAPWNGPFIMGLDPTAQALVAGNAVLLKPSEITPLAGRLTADLFRAVGLPEGVLQVLDGDGETGAALVEAGVDKIAFTGSTRTGRKVAEACARQLIPCSLELGGKDAMIVCEDAHVERAVGGAVFGAMFNAGQYCCSTERVYVAEAVAEPFIQGVVEKVKSLRQATEGEFDVGPMIMPSQLEVIERHMADALAKGAKVLVGGRRRAELGPNFYEPTVLVDVTHEMLIMREETFGPILPIMRIQDDREALALANDSSYGLSGTVWSRSEARGLGLAREMETGSVCVNEASMTFGAAEAPFGGWKSSGVGQVHGENGLKGYCREQSIILDRFGLREEHNWYPLTREKGDVFARMARWVWGTPIGRWMS